MTSDRIREAFAAMRSGSTKVIHEPDGDSWAQYDLEADPDEADPRPIDPALERRLRAHLGEIATALGSDAVDPDRAPEPLPEALAEELRALGYLE